MSETKIITLKATARFGNSTQESTLQVSPYVVRDAYFAIKKELPLAGDFGRKIIFKPITEASVGDDIYLVVETESLNGKTIKLKIHQGKQKVLVDINHAVTLLYNGKDEFEFKAIVGELANDTTIVNKSDFKNTAVTKVTLAPKESEFVKKWNDKIKKTTDKRTHLYLYVEADVTEEVVYYGYNIDGTDNDEKRFSNIKGKWLELKVEKYKVCPISSKDRSHFVIHCTAANMTKGGIASKTTYYKNKVKKTKRGAAHIYVMKDGSKIEIWPLTKKDVWATKLESEKGLKGQMFHIELNYGPPDKPTEDQYQTLADLYIEASNIEECWPIIVPHIEVDRGISNGHQDPTDFDYNHFYSILKNKGLPIDDIKKFDHDRYWGDKGYKVPWKTDKTNWPSILKGNPHK